MPAAKTKAELLQVTEKEWAKLTALTDSFDATSGAWVFEDDTSVKDVLAHRAHWIGLFFQWLAEGADGGPVAMPDHGVKWSELKPYNAKIRAECRSMPWDEVTDWLAAEHVRLLAYITSTEEAVLYGDPMPGGSGWTIGRYAEASGPSHYRSATKYLRAVRRAQAATAS